jgi:hypothetical protein
MTSYKGMSIEEQRQKQIDDMMQNMNVQGKSEKDRMVALRMAGAGQSQTAGEREAAQKSGPRRVTTRERTSMFKKAHVGNPGAMFRAKAEKEFKIKAEKEEKAKKDAFAERQAAQLKQGNRRGGISSGYK